MLVRLATSFKIALLGAAFVFALGANAETPAHADASAQPLILLQPTTARPGDVVLIEVDGAPRAPRGTLGNRELQFYAHGGHHEALAPLPLEQSAGALPVSLHFGPRGDGGTEAPALTAMVQVSDAGFPAKELTVASKFIEPPAKVRKQMAEDKAAFATAFDQALEPRLFDANFAWPRPPVFNAHFGDERTFNGHTASQHYGSDLAGRTGDPVRAANDGVVVMARGCYASGNTVLLHHGAKAFTAYFHLSRIDVKQGQHVKRGELLGLVGKTGRVTGPHLHFGMKIDGLYVDPESMLRLRFP